MWNNKAQPDRLPSMRTAWFQTSAAM